jgi:hypothetical protein
MPEAHPGARAHGPGQAIDGARGRECGQPLAPTRGESLIAQPPSAKLAQATRSTDGAPPTSAASARPIPEHFRTHHFQAGDDGLGERRTFALRSPALFRRPAGSRAVKRLYSEMAARQPDLIRPAHEDPRWRPEYEI